VVFQVIIALSATFIIGTSQVVTKEQTQPMSEVPTFASLAECQAGLLTYVEKINAAAGPRLTKFVTDNAQELGASSVRRDKYKVRCGRNAADESQDE
jgi:hypothetical protein